MFFKNLRLYRLTEQWTLSAEELATKLQEFEFHPCGSLDPLRYGFAPPLGSHGTDFVHACNGYLMICAKKQEKLLPGGVIKEQLEEKVRAISEAEARPVGRKERDALKDEIIFSLLPKAFTRSTLHYAYIDPVSGLIVVNAASAKVAEDLLSKLREALGSLRCLPVTPSNIPTQSMTHWVRESQAPHQFELGEQAELQATKDGRVVRCKKLDLTSSEFRNHLESGMHVSKIALTWKEAIHCVVDEQLGIKGLKFEDVLLDKANDRNPESKAEQFDADMAVMTLELKHFITALLAGFGGESSPVLEMPESAMSPPTATSQAATSDDQSDEDVMYPEAVQFVTGTGNASISGIQRRLRIGYNRAARLIERMEAEGIVTAAAHNGAREVIASESQQATEEALA